jgi:hypothetical protein
MMEVATEAHTAGSLEFRLSPARLIHYYLTDRRRRHSEALAGN